MPLRFSTRSGSSARTSSVHRGERGSASALGEYAPERVLSLVLCGNQPYTWNLESPIAKVVERAIAASRRSGMTGFVESFEGDLGYRLPEPERTWMLEKNDPAALEAAWESVQLEGTVSADLSRWRVP
ncbi:MAG TPA: hypothetical protein VLF14_06665 [Candidatus Binatia bacterium]|nr:hypothetical protein [Candidatus Binatia bacterium]